MTQRTCESWSHCWQHVVRVPALLIAGLFLSYGLGWLRTLDEPELGREDMVLEWTVAAGVGPVLDRLTRWLDAKDYEVHSQIGAKAAKE